MEKSPDDILYCVGCGRAVARSIPGQLLAITCVCGANAPILYQKGISGLDDSDVLLKRGWATPASLLRSSLSGGSIPHLEHYLGFSGHQSNLKTEVTRMLRALGAISYTECFDTHCREAFERSKQRYKEWMERRSGG